MTRRWKTFGKRDDKSFDRPIVRADFNTVQVHLQTIGTRLPSELDFYKSMTAKTVQMLEDKRLSQEQAKQFRLMMEETYNGG